MAKKIVKKSVVTKGRVAAAAGVAALGAGAYYLFGPDAKVHQKKAKQVLERVRKGVTVELKKAKEVTIPLYHKAVDMAAEKYSKEYKLHEKDIKAIAQKLKGEWKQVASKTKKKLKSLRK